MKLNNFKLEKYLGKYEFTVPIQLCNSDPEYWTMSQLLAMANNEELKQWQDLSLAYTSVEGNDELREEIVGNIYPVLDKDNILCFAGAQEGIYCSLYHLCNPGDHVIILTPAYQSLFDVPKSQGADITEIKLREENEWRIDPAEIRTAIKSNTKLLVINFPHNPTGQVINIEEQRELVKLLDEHGIYLFSDEVYRLLGPNKNPWSEPFASIYPKAISLGVMSKAYGMPGLRIGWIASQDKKMIEQISSVKHYSSICNSAPSELLAKIALRNSKQILNRNNKIVLDNMTILDEFIAKNSILSWVRPSGGCIGFMKLNHPKSVDEMCKELIADQGVLLMPGSVVNHSGNYFRIGFGRRNMPQGLARFGKYLEGLD